MPRYRTFNVAFKRQVAQEGDEGLGENRFRLLRNGTELEYSGGIKTGMAKEFARMLDAASQVRVLHLNGVGGRIAEADLMAAAIRKLGGRFRERHSCASTLVGRMT